MPEYKNVHGFDDANLKVKTVDYDEFKDHETRMQQKIDSIDVTSSADFNLLKSQVNTNASNITKVNNSLTTNVNNINYKISNEQKYREQGDQALKARLDNFVILNHEDYHTMGASEVNKWRLVTWNYGVTFSGIPHVAVCQRSADLDVTIIMHSVSSTQCQVYVYSTSVGAKVGVYFSAMGIKK